MNPEDDLRPEQLNGVSNPVPITGGDSSHSTDKASRRSSERLRHRDRAVTAYDFIPMALEQFPIIGRVVIACGVVGSLLLTGWMLSDLKGPQGRVGPEPVLALETSTPTMVPASPTPSSTEPTATEAALATEGPTATPSVTPQPIDINFNADSYFIVQGECTTLRWRVVGAETVLVGGAEVEHTEAEEVCPAASTSFTLLAQNSHANAESSFLVEVLTATATEQQLGCTGYDQNGQLVCKKTCTDNDPNNPCELD